MEVNNRTNKGGQGDGVYLDFSKAFDKMLYMRLLMKMRAMILAWTEDWPNGRRQSVGAFSGLAAGD